MRRRTLRDSLSSLFVSRGRDRGRRPRKPARPDAVRAYFAAIEGLEERTLLTGVTANQSSAIISGLQAVEAFGATLIASGPLARPLPIINESLGQVLDAHQAFAQGLEQKAEFYLNQQGVTPTLEGLLGQLNGTTNVTVAGVTIQTATTATATADTSAHSLTFQIAFSATGASSPLIVLGA